MVAARSIASRPSSRSSTDVRCRGGITLVELLVAMVVVGVVIALVVPLVLANQRAVELDQVRTAANQTLRSALDLIGSDVRIAGERFGDFGLGVFSPIELRADEEGSVLTLRRALLEWLPVCERNRLVGHQSSIRVASVPGGGLGGPDGPGGGAGTDLPGRCLAQRMIEDEGSEWPPNVHAWKTHLEETGAEHLTAVIFDPSTSIGQFFPATVRSSSTMLLHCLPSATSCVWNGEATYSVETNSIIGLLDVQEYRVRDGVLERHDPTTGETLRIADGIIGLEITLTLADGTIVSSFAVDQPWNQVRSVDIDLTAELSVGRTTLERSMGASFFPRNVMSR